MKTENIETENIETERKASCGIARTAHDTEQTMQALVSAYKSLPMQVINGTGGWVSKRSLITLYGELTNYVSYASCNSHYNETGIYWEEERKGTKKYARPTTDWKTSIPKITAKRMTELNAFITLVKSITGVRDLVALLHDDVVVHEDYFPSDVYPGMTDDMLQMLQGLIIKLNECTVLIKAED